MSDHTSASEHREAHVRYLYAFFAAQGKGRTDPTRRRYDRVLDHLLLYLDEVDVRRWLGAGPAEILSTERLAGGAGGFFRVFGLDELVCCVPGFLADEWLMPTAADARTQVSLIGRLLSRMAGGRLIELSDLGPAWYEAEAAVHHARRRLRPPPRHPSQTRQVHLQLIQGGAP